MAETLTTVYAPSRNTPDVKDFVPETIYGLLSEDWNSNPMPEKNSNGYIALDVANLSTLAATTGEVHFAAGPRMLINKKLPRKGSQRGMERKPPESAAAEVSDAGGEISACLLHVSCLRDDPTTPTAEVVVGAGRFRRPTFQRRSPWVDPRRVLVFFASLSSLGTLILLYFTLSMGKYSGQ